MEIKEKQERILPCGYLLDMESDTDCKRDNLEDYRILEHIATCDICASSYADWIEAGSLLHAPHYMKDNIVKQVLLKEKKEEILNQNKFSKRLCLFQYSLKVSLAMCGALLLLFSTYGFRTNGNDVHSDQRHKISDFSVNVNTGLRNFSNKIVQHADTFVSDKKDWEDENYDK